MSNVKLFQERQIRSVWNKEDQKWYFVITDVVQVLTDTPNPADYLKKMRKRDNELAKGWGQIVTPLSIDTKGGKQKLNCANAQGFSENKIAARKGGKIAGDARKALELESGKEIVTSDNYLPDGDKNRKKLKGKQKKS